MIKKVDEYLISELLNLNDIENKDGVMSYYDMIKYAKKGLKDLRDIARHKSKLAREVKNSSPYNFMLNNYYTNVKIKNNGVDSCSIIEIISPLTGEKLSLSKSKNGSLVSYFPLNRKNHSITKNHFDTIMESFYVLEKYSELFNEIDSSKYCYTESYNESFLIKIYYDDHGKIETKIILKNNEKEFSNKKILKKILDENKKELFKKIPINLNKDLTSIENNHILLIAQQEYLKENEKNKQKLKRKK